MVSYIECMKFNYVKEAKDLKGAKKRGSLYRYIYKINISELLIK